MLLSEITVDPPGGQARLPLTREEIAQAVDGFRVYWTLRTGDVEASAFLEMLLASNSLRFLRVRVRVRGRRGRVHARATPSPIALPAAPAPAGAAKPPRTWRQSP